MNIELLLPAIAIVFLLLNVNVSAQDNDQPERQYRYDFENNRIAFQNREFAIIADTSKNGSPEQALLDSTGEMLQHSIFVGILSVNYSRILRGEKTIFTVGGGLSFVPAAFDAGIRIQWASYSGPVYYLLI